MKNRQLKQKIMSWTFSKIPFSVLGKLTRTNLIIPYYHMVSDDDILHVKHLYKYKTIRQFKEDMDFLLTNYSPMGLLEILNCIKTGHHLPERAFLLTFDDGFREIYDVIAPILLEKGIPATFFITSSFLDNKGLCYQHKASLLVEKIREGISPAAEGKIKGILAEMGLSFSQLSEGVLKVDYRRREVLDRIYQVLLVDFQGYLNEKQPYLTSGQVKKLIDRGFTIGAHSIDHPYYASLSLNDQLQQSIGSLMEIREKFCLHYGAFAFPHSDSGVPKKFFTEFYNSGLVDVSFGTGGMVKDFCKNHLQRFSLEKPLMPAKNIIAFQYARRVYKSIVIRNPMVHE